MADQNNPAVDQPDVNSAFVDEINKAWGYHGKGDNESAENAFKRALEIDSQSLDAIYGLALSYKLQGKSDMAIETFNKVLSLIDDVTVKDNPSRASMIRHLSHAHITMLQGEIKTEAG